jgi:hypothetical protein
MMAEPKDMIVPMLKEIRQEMRDEFRGLRSEIDKRFNKVDARLESVESAQKNYRQALTADTMMSKLVTGDFEERIEALEKKVDRLLKAR